MSLGDLMSSFNKMSISTPKYVNFIDEFKEEFREEFRNQKPFYFVVYSQDKAIVPCCDVSKMKRLDSHFLERWDLYTRQLSLNFVNFDSEVNFLIRSGFEVKNERDSYIVLPPYFRGGYLDNLPDLSDCTSDQILSYIEITGIPLDDLRVNTSITGIFVNMRLTPETFLELSINNSLKLANLALANGTKSEKIWIAIVVWWKYCEDDESPCDQLINIIESKCMNSIFYCNYYIMLCARSISLQDKNLYDWCMKNQIYIIWDSDSLSDLATIHFYICSKLFSNVPTFQNELKKRGISK